MAKSKLSPDLERMLDDYKAVAIAQRTKLDAHIAKHRGLMQKRRGHVMRNKLPEDLRCDWNERAKEWRAKKTQVLAEAQRAHKPHYDVMVAKAKTLHGRDLSIFQRQFHTLNGYYTKADAELRAAELVDL